MIDAGWAHLADVIIRYIQFLAVFDTFLAHVLHTASSESHVVDTALWLVPCFPYTRRAGLAVSIMYDTQLMVA